MFRSSSNFDKHLEKATSISNLGPDWESILALCDCIKTNDITGKKALEAIKGKLQSTNPNIVLRSLEVLESCVKNCGTNFNMELATHPFMNDYIQVLRGCKDAKVREKMLELMANWAYAFRNEPAYHPITDKLKQLKLEGYKFPTIRETTDALFTAKTAPVWVEGPCCHRCRTEFSLVNRKHHCRHCGQVFCTKCSSKSCVIPDFGFESPVRVCDFCYDKLTKKLERRKERTHRSSLSKSGSVPAGASSAQNTADAENKKKEEELKAREEEELQLALALSLSENENKGRKAIGGYSMATSQPVNNTVSTTTQPKRSKSKTRSGKSKIKSNAEPKLNTDVPEAENMDPEMERYLNRDYWVNRTQMAEGNFSPSPSAPAPSISSAGTLAMEPFVRKEILVSETNGSGNQSAKMIGNIDAQELDQFKSALRGTLDIFINRLNLNKLRGRAITNDHGVQTMFLNLTNIHSKMVHYIQQTNDARANCERLQDKVSQIRDARAALDALRDEHREEIRRQQEEAERIKQAQMAQKLEIMRLKKQEYLQYQREMAIHRMQEQEREIMMMRNGQQPNWQAPPPQVQQFYQPAIQYSAPGPLPGVLTGPQPQPVPIGTTMPPVPTSMGGSTEPQLQASQPPQAFQPQGQQFQQYGPPQVGGMPQYGPQNAPQLPYSQPQTQFAGYGVYGQQSPMHQGFAQQPQPQQQQIPQQGFAGQVPQMAHQPMAQQQQQPEAVAASVNEAPLINFD